MGWAQVQGNSTENSTGAASVAVTISAVASGNGICGFATWDNGAGITCTSVADNQGNTYNRETEVLDTTNGQKMVGFSRTNITNGPVTITANLSGSATFRGILVDEFSGGSAASSDERDSTAHGGQFQNAPGTGTDAITSGTFTTTVNGALIWGGSMSASVLTLATVGTGFSGGTTNVTDNAKQTEFREQITAGSGTAATFTQGADTQRTTFMIALKALTAEAATGGTSSPTAAGTTKIRMVSY